MLVTKTPYTGAYSVRRKRLYLLADEVLANRTSPSQHRPKSN